MTRLPSLNALRAFEVAARHGSFTRAAAELHVTHAAISHQVKALEADLGVNLLRRAGRGLEVTASGQALAAALGEAFARMARAVAEAREGDRSGTLTISVEPSFAARWLVLRLGRFTTAQPAVQLRLSLSEAVTDFDREDADLGIRYGRGEWTGLRADLLMRARVFPVCSPSLPATGPSLGTPADLRHHTLLHEDSDQYWRDWLSATGVEGIDAGHGPRFDTAHMALAAAAAGHGVALADDALAAADLAEGRLVRLFDVATPTDQGYWLVTPPRAVGRPKVEVFRSWLLAEARLAEPGRRD